MSFKMTRWSLSLVIVTTLALGVGLLVAVPDSYSFSNCWCPSFAPYSTVGGWGKAGDCATAEIRAVENAEDNAEAACSPYGVCQTDPNYTITGACHVIGVGMVQVDVELRYKCFICMDEPNF